MEIKLENISKIYKDNGMRVEALQHVDLEIKEGESIAIMGASGSGKSTLLNILGCMDQATEGRYFLNGTEVDKFTDKRAARLRNEVFGFVVQDFALIENDTVERNVMLPLYYSHRYKKEKRKQVEKILRQVNILEKKGQLVNKLSGGQRQRVAIARALVNDAEIILADDPTGALDRQTSDEIMQVFCQLNREGHTVVIVTHDKEVASQCGRIIEIEDGQILQG